MSDYPAWVKPHLRKRLEEENAPKKPTEGLTPTIVPIAKPVPRKIGVGDIVRVVKPDPMPRGTIWPHGMDAHVGLHGVVVAMTSLGDFYTLSMTQTGAVIGVYCGFVE